MRTFQNENNNINITDSSSSNKIPINPNDIKEIKKPDLSKKIKKKNKIKNISIILIILLLIAIVIGIVLIIIKLNKNENKDKIIFINNIYNILYPNNSMTDNINSDMNEKTNNSCIIGEEEKCLTCNYDNNKCSSCNIGYKLSNGECILNYSLKAIYNIKKENEDVEINLLKII